MYLIYNNNNNNNNDDDADVILKISIENYKI